MKVNIACFTGNRVQRLPFIFEEMNTESTLIKNKLEYEIKRAIAKGYTHFISTMQLGIAMWAAEIVLRIKEFYPEITLEAILPYENQASHWTENQRDRYFHILSECNYVGYASIHYIPSCNDLANKYIVDKSSLLIAIYDENDKEAMTAVDYAKLKGLELVLIDISSIIKKSVD